MDSDKGKDKDEEEGEEGFTPLVRKKQKSNPNRCAPPEGGPRELRSAGRAARGPPQKGPAAPSCVGFPSASPV